jgi:hypothetical protein
VTNLPPPGPSEPPTPAPFPAQPFPGQPSTGQPSTEQAFPGPGYPPAPSAQAYPGPPSYYGTPAPGTAIPGAPQYGPPTPAPPKSNRTLAFVIAGVVALLVLCVGGGIAVALAANRLADRAKEATARPTFDPFDQPLPTGGPTPSTYPSPDEKDETPEVQELKLGETLVLHNENGDEYEVRVSNTAFRTKPCDPYALKPKNGGYLIADVSVAVKTGRADVSPFDFEFVTPSNVSMDNTAGASSACGNDLASIRGLKAPGKRAGQLVFDVPKAKGVVIVKTSTGEMAGAWTIG